MNLILTRHAYLAEATLGIISVAALIVRTLEEPWRPDPDGPGGQRKGPGVAESCVPDGVYDLVPHDGAKFKDVWCLVNPALGVYRQPGDIPAGQKWGRSAVLIHAGNSTADIEGCILVGERHGFEANKPWLYQSQVTLNKLRLILGGDAHTLTIRPTTGTAEIHE